MQQILAKLGKSTEDHLVVSSAPSQRRCISREEAVAIDKELREDYGFTQEQLVEMMGMAVAHAITRAFPLASLPRKQPTGLVICGPGYNGACGLASARHLKMFGYEPTVFYVKRSVKPLSQALTTQCEKLDIPFLSYLPTEVQLINDAYCFVVDAVFGTGLRGEVREPFLSIMNTLRQVKAPVASVDVPSGWDPDLCGNGSACPGAAGTAGAAGTQQLQQQQLQLQQLQLQPEVLVSLGAPKRCAERFAGRLHFLGGRFLPLDIHKKMELNLPEYPGTDCIVPLL
ncbi:yjeF N-terminal domain-containing protein 3 isoform X2 [Lampetra fluviatilis]